VEFALELTDATDGDGEPLTAAGEVMVLCETDNRVLFRGRVELTAGEARVPITLAAPGTYLLRVFVENIPYSELIAVRVVEPEYAGGSGTVDDPYLIATARQLDHVRYNLTAAFKLISDIDLDLYPYNKDEGWQPIGSEGSPFRGFFDGNGKRIRGLQINRVGEDDVGFFGVLGKGATLANFNLENVAVLGRTCVGGLVGRNEGGSIVAVRVSGTVSGFSDVGGLVGYNNEGYIRECSTNCHIEGEGLAVGGLLGDHYEGEVVASSAMGTVSGGQIAGGLVGYNEARIIDSYATVDTRGTNFVGGLVGDNYKGYITRSYAAGNVSGATFVGGLVGLNMGDIAHCYATGEVTGEESVGGFAGYNEGCITGSYATGAVAGSSSCGGFAGENVGELSQSYYDSQTTGRSQADNQWGIPRSTAEMKRQSTFAGWDFAHIWQITEGLTYPRLQWEKGDEAEPFSAGPEAPGEAGEVAANFAGGSGTKEDPYLIATAQQLARVKDYLSGHFKLIADIDLNVAPYNRGKGWEPIGSGDEPFTGSLDGNGKTIRCNRP